MEYGYGGAPERKFNAGLTVQDGVVEGYASLFGVRDQGGDVVVPGAYAGSLARRKSVKMLWQHDPNQPIGVWDVVREDGVGLYVKGRLLDGVQKAREAMVLLEAGAIEGMSIGYRTVRAERDGKGRALAEVELWEVSLVTFPMLPEARVQAKSDDWRSIAQIFRDATAAI